jgi:hypothetical protein
MRRWIPVVLTAWLVLVAGVARADQVDRQVSDLRGGGGYKVRLGAALALSRSSDARAIGALTDALDSEAESSIRKVAAIALGKLIDGSTPSDARNGAVASLDHASKSDKDRKVRDAATKALAIVTAAIKAAEPAVQPTIGTGVVTTPVVFVNVEAASDLSKRASASTTSLTKVVRGMVKQKGYAVDWPGGTPTQQQLATNGTRAFIVGTTVKTIAITAKGNKTEVGCTVAIRIAPWTGSDGTESWEANRAASASGSATAMTGSSDRAVAGGIRDCVEAVGEEITSRQVVPFIKRLASP